MLFKYAVYKKGAVHEKEGTPCQDALHYLLLDNIQIAGVADGIGSESHSDMASEIAVSCAVEECGKNIQPGMNDNEIIDSVKASFITAKYAVEDEADRLGYNYNECDTTLSLAVYINGYLYYGQSGDSGIIALSEDGYCVKITEQQRDEKKRVFPLFFTDHWVFGKAEGRFVSVLLATDGILETFFPEILAKEPETLYISHIMRFLDKDRLCIIEKGEETVQKEAQVFIDNIPAYLVDDDITLVALINTDIPMTPQPPVYYQTPDFDNLRLKREKELFPDLQV